MNKLSKPKTIIVVTLLLLIMGFPVSGDELNDTLSKQKEIANQQNRANDRLNKLTTKEEQTEKQIQQLSSQISTAKVNLGKKEEAYKKALKNVQIIQGEVNEKQEEMENRQETLRKRVRSIYEGGQAEYLEVLFQSEDISDFISKTEYLSRLIENDQDILTGIRVQQEELDARKDQLVAKVDEAKKLKEEAKAAKIYYDSMKSKKEIALAENKREQEDLLIQIEKLEKDSKSLESKIRNLQSQQKGNTVIGSINVWPTPGYQYITSPFAYRIHPITRKKSLHTGVDIAAPNKAKIIAAGSGIVIYSGWYGAYGNSVIIDHGNGISTLYAHMSSMAVSVGKEVTAGQAIGYVGSTGWSTGPHLHFEVRKNGVPTNPLVYF